MTPSVSTHDQLEIQDLVTRYNWSAASVVKRDGRRLFSERTIRLAERVS